jgi:iron complex transport system substrate-binding protein
LLHQSLGSLFWGALFFLIVFSGCSGEEEPKTPETSSIPQHRILSLSPHTTEIVYALGAANAVLGVTEYCRFPAEAQEKPKVGAYLNPNMEAMVALKPTVVLHAPGASTVPAQLQQLGFTTLPVPMDSLLDISLGVRLVAGKIGKEQQAESLIANFEMELERLKNGAESTPKKRVLLVLGSPGEGTLYGVGPKTFLDELLTQLGTENWLKESNATYPTVSRESLLANPPDVVVEIHTEEPQNLELTNLQEQTTRAWQRILGPLNTTTRVVYLLEPHLTIPGPGMIPSIERLQVALREPEAVPLQP